MMLKALTRFIASSCSLSIGDDIYAGWRPQEAVADSSLVQDGGAMATNHSTARAQARFTVETRGQSYHQTHARATAIFDALHMQRGVSLPATTGETVWYADFIEGMRPGYLGVDDQRLHLFKASYIVRGYHT